MAMDFGDYEVYIIDRTDAVVTWKEDGAKQYLYLEEGDEERLVNGADPVKEGWTDADGQLVCYENAEKRASTKKSKSAKKSQSVTKSFNDMVKDQRNKNKGIKKDISEIESLVQDIEEMKRKAKEVEEKMFAIDWNEYNMQAFPSKIADVYRALNTISDGLYIQFLM